MSIIAEAMEDLEVSCSETSECSTLDSELTSDLKELNVSGINDGDWCELPKLIELRTKLRTEMNKTETKALTLEQEICTNRVGEEKSLCGTCGLVREPRQRKIAELRLMHQAMLKSKPKHLLCIAGIITRLEEMILDGYLDFYCGFASNVTRCRQCRQEINDATTRSYLVSEFFDILEDQRNNCTNTENCSMTEACCACLDFMLLCLRYPDKLMIQDDEPKIETPLILFQNVLAQKLESLTAEFAKHQKELVSEISQMKENLQKCATKDAINTEFAKCQATREELISEMKKNLLEHAKTEAMNTELTKCQDAQYKFTSEIF